MESVETATRVFRPARFDKSWALFLPFACVVAVAAEYYDHVVIGGHGTATVYLVAGASLLIAVAIFSAFRLRRPRRWQESNTLRISPKGILYGGATYPWSKIEKIGSMNRRNSMLCFLLDLDSIGDEIFWIFNGQNGKERISFSTAFQPLDAMDIEDEIRSSWERYRGKT